MFGDKYFGRNAGYPTPESTPGITTCLRLKLPANAAWWAVYSGLLLTLTDEGAWQQFEGGISREDAAHCAAEIYAEAIENASETDDCGDLVPAPYWESATGADDELPPNEQIWYGYVSEGNFIEDAGVFVISNFLASSISPQAAILYATNQRKIRLSFFNGGGIQGVVKVYIEDALQAIVDLTGDEDEIIDLELLTGYIDEAVNILQVLDSVG
jgi:hypothetical protein